MDANTYPCTNLSYNMLVKGTLGIGMSSILATAHEN